MFDVMQDDDGVIMRDGDLVLDGDIDGIAQQCEIRIGMNRAEWWLDESIGLPWFFGIMGTKLPASTVAKMVVAEGSKTAGVSGIVTTSTVFVGGKLSVFYNVKVGADTKEASL